MLEVSYCCNESIQGLLLSAWYVPGTGLSVGEKRVNKAKALPP